MSTQTRRNKQQKRQDLQRAISHKLSHLFAYALEPPGKPLAVFLSIEHCFLSMYITQ